MSIDSLMVPRAGVEPARLSDNDFKSARATILPCTRLFLARPSLRDVIQVARRRDSLRVALGTKNYLSKGETTFATNRIHSAIEMCDAVSDADAEHERVIENYMSAHHPTQLKRHRRLPTQKAIPKIVLICIVDGEDCVSACHN